DQDRETSVDGSQQEEGPEAAREKRPSVAGPKSGDRDHDRAFRNVMRFISMRPGQFMTNVLYCLDPERTGKRCPSRVRLVLISGHALGGMACQSRARIGLVPFWPNMEARGSEASSRAGLLLVGYLASRCCVNHSVAGPAEASKSFT